MNTRWNGVRRIEEEIAPPHGDQDPQLEEEVNVEQVSANPPPWMDEDIRASLLLLAQASTLKSQVMTAQASAPQQVSTMASRLRDFTRMKGQEKSGLASCSSDAPKMNLFYALRTKG